MGQNLLRPLESETTTPFSGICHQQHSRIRIHHLLIYCYKDGVTLLIAKFVYQRVDC